MIKVKRVYEASSKEDGYRILVDRLWPRGVSKEKAKVDLWMKEIAPSNELREQFCHNPRKWEEFRKKYAKELQGKKVLLDRIKEMEKEMGVVTLLYAAKDEAYNNAVALSAILEKLSS